MLNHVDTCFADILQRWRSRIILVKDIPECEQSVDPQKYDTDMANLKLLLKFTAQFLRNAIHKDSYNSTEVRCRV